MRFRLFSTITLSTLWIPLLANAQTPVEAPATRTSVMVHTWKQPGDPGSPERSIAALGQCGGTDRGFQGRIDALRGTQGQLDMAYADVQDRSARLQQASQAIADEKAKLAQSFASYRESFDALEQRQAEIESLRGDPRMNAPMAKELNARIASFNLDLAARNKRRESLDAAQQALEARVSAHNAAAAETRQRAADFAARNAEFSTEATRFDEDLARHAAQCAGRRQARK